MMTYNSVQIVARLTRDPEIKVLGNGGKLAKLGCVVDGPGKKNNDTGQWESEPVWLDVEVWDRGERGRMASLCEERLQKGSMVFLSTKLKMDNWTDRQSGAKRTKIVLVADEIRFLDPSSPRQADPEEEPPPAAPQPAFTTTEEDIPF